ncbi:MAG: TIGR03435 family protein, partial [Acidobacteriota bacterium]|nr:TIGR03435 family protein [Acidobacteriota bacterium]
ALLAERFHLQVHRETRVLPLYALVVARGGPKLEKSKTAEADCAEQTASTGTACHTIMGGRGRGLHGEAVTVGDIAAYVENWTDRPLLDETGISGLFNVQTTGWIDLQPGAAPAPGAKAEDGSDMADIPSLFTVLDRLGLKMEARKGPVEVVVIDRLEKPPAN